MVHSTYNYHWWPGFSCCRNPSLEHCHYTWIHCHHAKFSNVTL